MKGDEKLGQAQVLGVLGGVLMLQAMLWGSSTGITTVDSQN